jgi:hypothetical protein
VNQNGKRIFDPCCGGKMFWFDKHNPDVEFCDKRVVAKHEYYPHRYIEVNPDTVCDFTNLPFADETFHSIVFDPPSNMGGRKVLDGLKVWPFRRKLA